MEEEFSFSVGSWVLDGVSRGLGRESGSSTRGVVRRHGASAAPSIFRYSHRGATDAKASYEKWQSDEVLLEMAFRFLYLEICFDLALATGVNNIQLAIEYFVVFNFCDYWEQVGNAQYGMDSSCFKDCGVVNPQTSKYLCT
eukprot:Gb_12596 [translate_table: standard]